MLSPRKLVKVASLGRKIRMPYSSSLQTMVEKGHFVIYAIDRVHFAMPLSYLQHAIFQELLRMSEEEFGISSEGLITVPCDAASLEYMVSRIKSKGGVATEHDLDIKSLLDSIAAAASTCSNNFASDKDRAGQNIPICGY